MISIWIINYNIDLNAIFLFWETHNRTPIEVLNNQELPFGTSKIQKVVLCIIEIIKNVRWHGNRITSFILSLSYSESSTEKVRGNLVTEKSEIVQVGW